MASLEKKTVSQWERDKTGRVKGIFLACSEFDWKCIHTIKYKILLLFLWTNKR